MSDVKIFLKSKRKPLVFTFESTEKRVELLCKIESEIFITIGQVTIAVDDISHIIFEKTK